LGALGKLVESSGCWTIVKFRKHLGKKKKKKKKRRMEAWDLAILGFVRSLWNLAVVALYECQENTVERRGRWGFGEACGL
jgi:hypothetical protein